MLVPVLSVQDGREGKGQVSGGRRCLGGEGVEEEELVRFKRRFTHTCPAWHSRWSWASFPDVQHLLKLWNRLCKTSAITVEYFLSETAASWRWVPQKSIQIRLISITLTLPSPCPDLALNLPLTCQLTSIVGQNQVSNSWDIFLILKMSPGTYL